MITKEVKPTKRKDYNKDARLEIFYQKSRVDYQIWCGDCNHPDRQRKFHDSWLCLTLLLLSLL